MPAVRDHAPRMGVDLEAHHAHEGNEMTKKQKPEPKKPAPAKPVATPMPSKPKRLAVATLAAIMAIASSGCVTVEEMNAHRESVAAWERVEIARAQALSKRFEALGVVAARGDTTAQVAVAFAVNSGSASNVLQAAPMPAAPDAEARAYRWASLILPTATTIAVAGFGAKVQMNASDNAARVQEASYGTIGSVAGSGYSAASSVALAGFDAIRAMPQGVTTTNTMTIGAGGAGVVGDGSASVDASRRCAPSWTQPLTLTGSAGAFVPGSTSYSNPFNC
jgi:hypothetical protein